MTSTEPLSHSLSLSFSLAMGTRHQGWEMERERIIASRARDVGTGNEKPGLSRRSPEGEAG